MFDESLYTHPSQIEATQQNAHGSERGQCMFDDERAIAYFTGLKIFVQLMCTDTNCHVKIWEISGAI